MTPPPARAHALAFLTFGLLALAGCAASAADTAAQAPPGPAPAASSVASLAEGAFSEEQAARGADVFAAVCGECHATREFRGADFFFNWEGSSVGRFVELVQETMPEDDPGGLPREQYLAVAAYVLQLNGFPAGAGPLPDDAAALDALVIRRPGEGTPLPRDAGR